VKLSSIAVANGSYWHVVAGCDRQLSYWIFYISTGSKWHKVTS